MAAQSGEWLEKSLLQICGKLESGLDLDADLISGLVSFCELAPPPDAAEYLTNIIGQEAGQHIIQEYMQKRGYVESSNRNPDAQSSKFQAYMKPRADEVRFAATKKQQPKVSKEATTVPITQDTKNQTDTAESRNASKGSSNSSKKKKSGKAISLAEAAKGSVVFQQGKPCACQARRHKLVSNCLSCGKIICEQEGEGPCSFCGALVLRENSTYAGLDMAPAPLSDKEAAAEAYAKRLVDYDRNAAARTKVIDDQSDYYAFEENTWLSEEEKELLRKKQKEIQEADEARRKKVIVKFDLVGRKVMMAELDDSGDEIEYGILGPPEVNEQNRIKPNPTIAVQPIFVDPGPSRNPVKGKQKQNARVTKGLCLEISGRVQHDCVQLRPLLADSQQPGTSSDAISGVSDYRDEPECSLDYN